MSAYSDSPFSFHNVSEPEGSVSIDKYHHQLSQHNVKVNKKMGFE